MQVILFALFCTMTFVRTYSVEDAVRGSRIQVAESDELSSENEDNATFQRFIGETRENSNAVDDYLESMNRKKRSQQNAEKSPENSELKSRHASECEDGRKHNRLKINHDLKVDDLRRSRRFLNDRHRNQKKRESKTKKKRRKKKMPESTSPENVDRIPTEETLETTTLVALNDSTTCVVLTDSTTEEEVVTETSKDTTTTEKILETSTKETTETPTTTAISVTPTEKNLETKELTMKLICKVGKSVKNLRKVFQCSFGNSDSASFLIPKEKQSIDTYAVEENTGNLKGNGNSFNMIHEMLKETTMIPEGNRTSWRMIEATGVRARVIEKTPAAGESHRGKNRKRKKKHAQKKSKNLKVKT